MHIRKGPLLYWQIKAGVDRLHDNNEKFSGNKKAMIFAASALAEDGTMEGLQKTYEGIIRYLNWKNAGMLFAKGCPVREVIETTDYLQQSYEMGKNIV